QARVDLEVHRGDAVVGGRRDPAELLAGRGPDVAPLRDRRAEVGVRAVQPGEDRHADAGVAKRERGGYLECGERVGSGLEGRAGDGQHLVPIRLGLEGEHRARGSGDRGERGEVVAECRQMYAEFAHRASLRMRWPSPAVTASGVRSVQAAHSRAVGAPSAGSPKTTTSAPACTSASPRSITNWSIAMRPTSGYRSPSMARCARLEPRRGIPSA